MIARGAEGQLKWLANSTWFINLQPMSKYKEQRLRQQEDDRKRATRRKRGLAAIVLLAAIAGGVWHFRNDADVVSRTLPAVTSGESKPTFASLLALKPHQLEGSDIALLNLLCAEGLRGSGKLDLDKTLDGIDDMATRVRVETERNFHRFRSNPAEYENSEAYFRMAMLVTVLQQDFGVRYNPDRVTPVGVIEPNGKFFADSRDVFLHGLIGETKTGTCSSLPVLYIAVGRRLKYPLSLVSAKNHLFVRWEDQETRMNIEATSIGVTTYDDAHYRKWPYPMTDQEETEHRFLKSMTASEECAVFLSIRGHCLMAAGRTEESLAAHQQAVLHAPDAKLYQIILETAKQESAARTQPQLPGVGMPPDPSLWDMPPETAWMLWNRKQAQLEQNRLEGIPDPTPGFPSPVQPFGQKNYGLPPASRNR